MGLNWGDVPAWVGSVLTGVALLIAAITYRKSVHDSERAQASMVTVWVQSASGAETVHVKNDSNSSVYAVTAYYGGESGSKNTSPYYRDDLKKLGRWASVGPGEEKSAPYKRNLLFDPEIPSLYFRDSNGVDWIRDYRARLERHNYTVGLSEFWYKGDIRALGWPIFLIYILSSILDTRLSRFKQRGFRRLPRPAGWRGFLRVLAGQREVA